MILGILAEASNSTQCVDCSATPLYRSCSPGYVNILTLQTCEECPEWLCIDPIFVSTDGGTLVPNQPLMVADSENQPIYYDPTSAVNTSKLTGRNIVIGTVIGATFFLLLVGALIYRICWKKHGRSRRRQYCTYRNGVHSQMQELKPANAGTRSRRTTRIQSAVFSLISKSSNNANRQQPFDDEETQKDSYWQGKCPKSENIQAALNPPKGCATEENHKSLSESNLRPEETAEVSEDASVHPISYPSPYLIRDDDEYQRVLTLGSFKGFNVSGEPIYTETKHSHITLEKDNQVDRSVNTVNNSSPKKFFEIISRKVSSSFGGFKPALNSHSSGNGQPSYTCPSQRVLPAATPPAGDYNHVRQPSNIRIEPAVNVSEVRSLNRDPIFPSTFASTAPMLKLPEIRFSDTIDEIFNQISYGNIEKKLEISPSQEGHSINGKSATGYETERENKAEENKNYFLSPRINRDNTERDKLKASIPLFIPEDTLRYLKQYSSSKDTFNSETETEISGEFPHSSSEFPDKKLGSPFKAPADPSLSSTDTRSVDFDIATEAPMVESKSKNNSSYRGGEKIDEQLKRKSRRLEEYLNRRTPEIPANLGDCLTDNIQMSEDLLARKSEDKTVGQLPPSQLSNHGIAMKKDFPAEERFSKSRTELGSSSSSIYRSQKVMQEFSLSDVEITNHDHSHRTSDHLSVTTEPETSVQYDEYSGSHGHESLPSHGSHDSNLQYAVPRRVSAASYKSVAPRSQYANYNVTAEANDSFASWEVDLNTLSYPLVTSQSTFFRSENSDNDIIARAHTRPYHDTTQITHSNYNSESDILPEPGLFSSSSSASPAGSNELIKIVPLNIHKHRRRDNMF